MLAMTGRARLVRSVDLSVGCAIGAFLMRGAGCTWNDITDREFDASVERTRSRPDPFGAGHCQRCAGLADGIQALLVLCHPSHLQHNAILLGIAVAGLPVAVYPFAKAVHLVAAGVSGHRLQLGGASGLDGPYRQASAGRRSSSIYGGIAWTLFYDTIYAHQDTEDDALIGVKSTARLFGEDTDPDGCVGFMVLPRSPCWAGRHAGHAGATTFRCIALSCWPWAEPGPWAGTCTWQMRHLWTLEDPERLHDAVPLEPRCRPAALCHFSPSPCSFDCNSGTLRPTTHLGNNNYIASPAMRLSAVIFGISASFRRGGYFVSLIAASFCRHGLSRNTSRSLPCVTRWTTNDMIWSEVDANGLQVFLSPAPLPARRQPLSRPCRLPATVVDAARVIDQMERRRQRQGHRATANFPSKSCAMKAGISLIGLIPAATDRDRPAVADLRDNFADGSGSSSTCSKSADYHTARRPGRKRWITAVAVAEISCRARKISVAAGRVKDHRNGRQR